MNKKRLTALTSTTAIALQMHYTVASAFGLGDLQGATNQLLHQAQNIQHTQAISPPPQDRATESTQRSPQEQIPSSAQQENADENKIVLNDAGSYCKKLNQSKFIAELISIAKINGNDSEILALYKYNQGTENNATKQIGDLLWNKFNPNDWNGVVNQARKVAAWMDQCISNAPNSDLVKYYLAKKDIRLECLGKLTDHKQLNPDGTYTTTTTTDKRCATYAINIPGGGKSSWLRNNPEFAYDMSFAMIDDTDLFLNNAVGDSVKFLRAKEQKIADDRASAEKAKQERFAQDKAELEHQKEIEKINSQKQAQAEAEEQKKEAVFMTSPPKDAVSQTCWAYKGPSKTGASNLTENQVNQLHRMLDGINVTFYGNGGASLWRLQSKLDACHYTTKGLDITLSCTRGAPMVFHITEYNNMLIKGENDGQLTHIDQIWIRSTACNN